MTQEEQEAREQEELTTGPFRVFKESVRSGMRILVNCTKNKRLLGRLKSFNRHFNMVLVEVTEMWTEQRKRGRHSGRTESVQKGRYISKMFLRGDSVILVIRMGPTSGGDDAEYDVMGPRGTPRLDIGSAKTDQLDEREDTHVPKQSESPKTWWPPSETRVKRRSGDQ